MKGDTIEIDGYKCSIKFGYGAIRRLGGWWDLPGYTEVVEKVGDLVPKDDNTAEMLSFGNLELLADVVLAGIVNADGTNEGAEFDRDTVIDAFFHDMDMLKRVFELFMASMPRAKEPAEPPKKKRTAKTATRDKGK